ncbi:pyruvate formate lyase family protein [Diplocloster agilis]|uniref:Pyruvate-formate lyase n=1 Tax=Diplocloster agilis TaxID=2850323 RepID=A0A949NGR6_9FIRM|nr:pyruvate formate lyase family protein [Diplocloster agilis]MBU9734985.1 pyruvate-formate lyase [Diplocloster agilis]MBU9742488.1 pyruvate-formate lyase [Diplocloster agilis]
MKRIDRIKKRIFEVEMVSPKEWWGQDETILTSEEIKKEPLVVRKALAVEYVMRNMPAKIKPDELIVGLANYASAGLGFEFPDYALPEEKEEGMRGAFTYKSVWGHHPGDYQKLLQSGLQGLRQEILEQMELECKKKEPQREKLDYYRAMIISLNAVRELAVRYSQLALKQAAKEREPARRKELLEISRICAKVPEQPAQTFHEALQSMFLFFCALHSSLEMVPIARTDQYFYPYYKRDIESGRITEEEAEELVGSWLAKFNERVQILPEYFDASHANAYDKGDGGNPDHFAASFAMENDQDYNFGTSANNFLLNMILGGCTPQGEDAVNDLTYLLIEQWNYLEAIMPVLSVRLNSKSPQKLYELCADILRKGGSGEPALYNDEVIIKGLTDLGIPLEEARDYSNDGCWEVLIPGRTNFGFEYIKVLQTLEYVLNRGASLIRKRQEAPDYGDPAQFKTYEEFYTVFMKCIHQKIIEILQNKLKYRDVRHKIAPSPLLSTIVSDCIQRGRDLSDHGARYNIYPLMVCELANCVDSLAVIKKLVYEDRICTMSEVTEAVRMNFEGKEDLRQMFINRVPKFGNDEPYVDGIAAKLLEDIRKEVSDITASMDIDDLYVGLGIATFETYMSIGHNIGASPDGRLSQEPVSSNYSPSIGMDLGGPTAAIKSITTPDLVPYFIGCPLDMQINYNEAQGDEGLKRMVALIKSFLELGGVILTITGTSEEDLLNAQKDPAKYRSLRVRMGGLSAYFVALPKEHQDLMIRKVKHGL